MTELRKIEIKQRFSGAVLFTAEIPADTPSGLAMRAALEQAVSKRAYLRCADLGGAYPRGAYLRGAYLRGADLRDADLGGADLRGADLRGAYLRGADLRDADLRDADLGGAKLTDSLTLVGSRPVLSIGPLGSRNDTLFAFITSGGAYVRAGCFFGTLDAFVAAVGETHGDTNHGREYAAAIALIRAHAAEWTPAEEPAQEAA